MPILNAEIYEDINKPKFIFLTNNNADYELASSVNQTLDLDATIVNIKTNDDLNQIFLAGNYFESFDSIVLVLNQISKPLNISLISSLDTFVSQGKVFGIVSTQIWKFNSSFHSLMSLEIPTQGQKEYPMGNLSDSIEISITNNTLIKDPSQYPENTSVGMEGGVGLTQATRSSVQVASSFNPPFGNTSFNAFEFKTGFIFALPLSPIDISPSLPNMSQFVTSIASSGLEVLERNQDLNQTSVAPGRILFLISNEDLEVGIGFTAVSILLISFAYFVSKIVLRPKLGVDIPKDKTILAYLLTPIFFIGQILYPPIVRRIDSYDVLDNEYRSHILTILDEREFLHFRELKRELKIGTSSLRWHLQVLEDFRLIDRQVFGQYEIYYLIRRIPELGFLKLYFSIISAGGYRIAQAFFRVNSWELNALAEYLGQSKEAVKYHLKKLEQIQLIQCKENKYILNSQKVAIPKFALERRSKSN
jgi:predicted transcriptional regulator